MTLTTLAAAASTRQGDGGIRCDFAPSSNLQLLQLVTASGLSSAVAMTIFNRGLGAAACSESQWKGFLAAPGSPRYLELSAEQLAHAVHQFARISTHGERPLQAIKLKDVPANGSCASAQRLAHQ